MINWIWNSRQEYVLLNIETVTPLKKNLCVLHSPLLKKPSGVPGPALVRSGEVSQDLQYLCNLDLSLKAKPITSDNSNTSSISQGASTCWFWCSLDMRAGPLTTTVQLRFLPHRLAIWCFKMNAATCCVIQYLAQ